MERLDASTMIFRCGFKLPWPYSNRSFVCVGYLAMDAATKAVLYIMFSHHDEQDIQRANPKGVVGEVAAGFLVTPTTEGCRVVLYSRADIKLVGAGLLASNISKSKPRQVSKIYQLLSPSDPGSSKRIKDAHRAFAQR